MVLEKTLESPLNRKEIKPVNPKGNEPWIFTGRTVMLKLQDAKSWLTGKDPDAGKDWGQKGAIEDEMVGRHHQLNRHEFEQTPRESERRGSLACCSPWGHKESDTTERQQRRDVKLIRHRLSQRPELIQKPPSWALSFLPQHLAPIGRGSEARGWRWVMDFS